MADPVALIPQRKEKIGKWVVTINNCEMKWKKGTRKANCNEVDSMMSI